MTPEEKIDALHNAKVINKNALSDAYKARINDLSDEDVYRLIEIAEKLHPGRPNNAEISLLF